MTLRVPYARTTRRRVLGIVGAAAGLTLVPPMPGPGTPVLHRWRGTALGAEASIALHHPDTARARRLIRLAVAEIARLERIFSLHRPDSALVALNQTGRLKAPPLELVAVLGEAGRIWRLSEGAFDVTVQPLWQLHAAHFARVGADPDGPTARAIAAARERVGMDSLEVDPAEVRFARPGMAATLNGIAQGYITDRVTELLRAEGLGSTLVDLGEIRALGSRPAGGPWRIGLGGPGDRYGPGRRITLADRAVATSSPAGTVLDPAGHHHHLFDPATGRSSEGARRVSVVAPDAMLADALSTALAIVPRERIAGLTAAFADIEVIVPGDAG